MMNAPRTTIGAMASVQPAPTIVEQVYRTILDAICDGRLAPGERLTQESVAEKLAVSRQQVGQALLLLKQQKFVSEAGRRGLMVAPLDRDFMRSIYELRLGIEPLAAALAARNASADDIARGERMIAAGKEAVRHNSIAELIAADMEFHMYVYELSRNRLFVELMQELWNHLRRAMREVLQHREYRKAIACGRSACATATRRRRSCARIFRKLRSMFRSCCRTVRCPRHERVAHLRTSRDLRPINRYYSVDCA